MNAAAAEADLLLEEEKKPQSKKKKHKVLKIPTFSICFSEFSVTQIFKKEWFS